MATSTNYAQWKNQFSGQAKITVNASKEVVQEAAQALYQRIVERTPVGNPSLWEQGYAPTGYVPGALKAAWTIEQEGDDYIISNDLPYAYRVETGWSQQAPSGMMRISIKEFGSILADIAKRRGK